MFSKNGQSGRSAQCLVVRRHQKEFVDLSNRELQWKGLVVTGISQNTKIAIFNLVLSPTVSGGCGPSGVLATVLVQEARKHVFDLSNKRQQVEGPGVKTKRRMKWFPAIWALAGRLNVLMGNGRSGQTGVSARYIVEMAQENVSGKSWKNPITVVPLSVAWQRNLRVATCLHAVQIRIVSLEIGLLGQLAPVIVTACANVQEWLTSARSAAEHTAWVTCYR